MLYLGYMPEPVFLTNFFEQKRTIESLLKESRANSPFYLFLFGSAFITTLGLLLNNAVVIVGGMLVAPLLFPILSLGMGVATSSTEAIHRSVKIILKSVGIVFLVSLTMTFILNGKEITSHMVLASTPDLFYFLIAFVSGVVAAYAWVKENISSTLPGIAVSVSLIPPLAVVGISISLFSSDLLAGSLTLFLINFLGIVVASTIVFSLFGFSRLHGIQEKRIEEEGSEEKIREAALKEAKIIEKEVEMKENALEAKEQSQSKL